jgi:phage baseplate assembly protein gpV
MPQRARTWCVAAGLLILVLACASPAGANEFCVAPATGCAGGQQASLQASLDAALAAPGPDTVRLPAGDVAGPGAYDTANPDNTVDVVGAGRDATVITSRADGYIFDVRRAGVVSDLTIREVAPTPAGQFGSFIHGTVERVHFATVDGGPAVDGTARHVLATGTSYLMIHGTIEDSELQGAELATGTGDTIVRRVRSEGPTPVFGQNRSLVISSSLFIATTPDSDVASFLPSPVPASQATVVLSNVTLIGGGGACTGLGVAGDNFYTRPGDDQSVENATLANSIVRGCPTSVSREGGSGNHTANLTILDSDLDLSPAAVASRGDGTLTAGPGEGNVLADPLFLGLPGFPQLLRFDSPAIDRGLTNPVSAEESATDLAGNPRIVDGDGNGVATRDLGAFEYQRRPPAVTASAGSANAAIGQTVTFSGSATEADPGESVTGYLWRFDDGATSAGSIATHAFSTPGAHAATLTAVDSAGVGGSATATVSVLAARVAAAAVVRSISLSATTFRAAARGASIAARRHRRGVPVGTTVQLGLTAPAAVALTVQRRAHGGRSGRRCAAPSRRNRHARACTRWIPLRGSATRAAGAPASFRFTGRWNGKALRPGRYRLTAQAGRAAAKSVAFRIVR